MALLSKGRLSKMMLEILAEFPSGTKNLQKNITLRLGMIGRMSTPRDIDAAISNKPDHHKFWILSFDSFLRTTTSDHQAIV